MPIRNPFAKKPGAPNGVDPEEGLKPTFERQDTVGSKSSSAMSIKSEQSQEPAEYKMSVVNDSGVFIPPSPPEKKGFWTRKTNNSEGSSKPISSLTQMEPFSISRESFDSYRRSFDISAKSPVLPSEIGRQRHDSARLPRLPRSAMNVRHFDKQPPTAEEGFEDIGLNDEQSKPRKRGFFPKFGDTAEPAGPASSTAPVSTSRFHLPGRKRGQSGQGAELGNMDKPGTMRSQEVAQETK